MDDQAPEPEPSQEAGAAHEEPTPEPAPVLQEVQTEVADDPSDKPAERRKSWKEGSLTRGMEFAVVLATVVNAGVALVQWRAMEKSNALSSQAIRAAETANQIARDTLKSSQRQTASSEKQAKADRAEAERLAKVARAESIRQFETTLAQRSAETSATLRAMQESNRITRDAAAESNRMTSDSLHIAHLEFIEQYRPQVRAIDVTTKYTAQETAVTVTLENIGKKPAEDLMWAGHLTITDHADFDPSGWTKGYDGVGGDYIEPDGKTTLQFASPPIVREVWERIEAEKSFAYIFGWVGLGVGDFDPRPRILHFCYRFAAVLCVSLTGPSDETCWFPCGKHNEVEYVSEEEGQE